jgi:hypothetical protein
MQLPPREVPFAIVSSHPELLLLDEAARGLVKAHIQKAPALSAFVQTISQQGAPGPSYGWATVAPIILSNGQPAKDSRGHVVNRWTLSATTLNALPELLGQTLAAVRADPALEGLCWNVQAGIPPGQASNQSGPAGWKLGSLPPRFGVGLPSVSFDSASRTFILLLTGVAPRHFGAVATFFHDGRVITPSDWTSRLPAGAPGGFETAAAKFAGLLEPSGKVAGIPVNGATQSLSVPMESAADSLEISFQGLGNGAWPGGTAAAGLSATAVLDCAIPAILIKANGGPQQEAWFQALLANPATVATLMGAGSYLLDNPIVDTPSLLAALASNVDRLLLDTPLAALHDSINQAAGADAVENAAPSLNWIWATLGVSLTAGTWSAILSTPPSIVVPLNASMVTPLTVTVKPDARWGKLPDAAATYTLTLRDADSIEQTRSGPIPGDTLAVEFSGVRAGAASIQVSLFAAGGLVCGSRSTAVTVDGSGAASVTIVETPAPVTASTQYQHKRILTFDSANGYAWQVAGPPVATVSALDAACTGQNTVCGLVGITLAEQARAVGYGWRASRQGLPPCSGGDSAIESGYLLQSLGVISPGSSLKSLSCAYIQQPGLVYARSGEADFLLDATANGSFLRTVTLDAETPFPVGQTSSFGQMPEQGWTKLVVHPAGYVIAVDRQNARLWYLRLLAAPAPDAQAPSALSAGGSGIAAGLLEDPTALDVTPEGVLLVLENGAAQVLAFDLYGNPVAIFANGSPSFPLRAETGVAYLDLAASPAGLLYVLSVANGGASAQDYRLDVYSAGGEFVCRTAGVAAARIVVDSRSRAYTLNYATIGGTGGHKEPSLSQWFAAS